MHSFSGTYLNVSDLKLGFGKTTLDASLGILKLLNHYGIFMTKSLAEQFFL